MLGHNVRAVSEFYTRTAKMPGKCPVSDCYLELCLPLNDVSEHSVKSTLHTSSLKKPQFFNQTREMIRNSSGTN